MISMDTTDQRAMGQLTDLATFTGQVALVVTNYRKGRISVDLAMRAIGELLAQLEKKTAGDYDEQGDIR